jgi:DNA polymerase-3 subunit alpha
MADASARPFAHLHCHTQYSLLDGANRIPDLVKKTKELGMNSLAITDHGNLYGALEFYSKCKDGGINPILGYEAYIAPGSRFEKGGASRTKEASYHLTLLAKNRAGFQNLIKLASSAFLEGFYYKPRIDKEILAAHSEGLICLSGCCSAELSSMILENRMDEARRIIGWYRKTFGEDYYLEIQNCGLEIQRLCAEGTIDLAKELGVPLVATSDTHYLTQEDAAAHDVLLCVNTHTSRADTKRMRLDSDQFFLRSPEQMYTAFPGMEEAVARSQEIANKVDIQLDLKTRHFPVFTPPDEKKDIDYLLELCEKGLIWRYGEDGIEQKHRDRLKFELGVIGKMGFASYFLIVWDFARFATENGIPCLARGSACGAIVAYCLGLSNVCPLKYDLLFERFLDPNRVEAPDIDIDFCRDRRELVINYVKQKYGHENVAQIGTFGTLKARAVIRDVARALQIPLDRVDEIAKSVPETLNIKLKDAIQESPDLLEAYNSDTQIKEVLDIGMKLEGLARSCGTHAAGVVIGDRPLVEYVPLQRITGKEDIITQWTEVEKAGLLKMDFLGLRNLSILDKAVINVKKRTGKDIDPQKFPMDDKATFALLQRGETKGIFQLESGGMRDLLQKMRPDSFLDIIATSALYRPGPLEGGMVMTYVNVKNKKQDHPKVHPIIDAVLNETYGVMVYQEQVMRILNRLGGIELSSSYACIKAISKKKLDLMMKFKEQFLTGAQKEGLDEKQAGEFWDMIEKFAGYGFNKSHSTAYGAIAYQTAFLKAHYPGEFMAALLSCEMEDTERINEHVDDARRMNLKLYPPDINRSDTEFSVVGDKELSFGLSAIKGLGTPVVKAIAVERKARGPFKNIFDLAERLDSKTLSKGALEILIKAGALDSFKASRSQHLAVVERAIQGSASKQRDRLSGQKSLFGDEEEKPTKPGEAPATFVLPEVPELTHSQILAFEKEVIGFYLTSHPLSEHSTKLAAYASHTNKALVALEDRAEVMVGGMIGAIKKAQTKKPSKNGHQKYVNFDLEDVTGIMRCIMWPEDFARQGELVKSEEIVFVRGRIDKKNREPNLVVSEIITLEAADKKFTEKVIIRFQKGMHTEADFVQARGILCNYPGKCDVLLVVESFDDTNPEKKFKFPISSDLRVSADAEMERQLSQLLGKQNVRFIGDAKKKTKQMAYSE